MSDNSNVMPFVSIFGGSLLFPTTDDAQMAKFVEKVHKPPLWINVIHFELNGLDASAWVPWSPSDPKKS